MKFDTAALIQICDTEIEARTRAAEEAFAAAEAEYEQSKAAWLASDHPAALASASRSVLEKVRKGRIVTVDDLKVFGSGRWDGGGNHAFTGIKPERKTKGRQPSLGQIQALRDFLGTVTDAEVTSSGLRDVGFRNIAAIIRMAVR